MDGTQGEPVREDDAAVVGAQGCPEPEGFGGAYRPQEVRAQGDGAQGGGGAAALEALTAEYSELLPTMPVWELGDEFNLLVGSGWTRRVRVVRVTEQGPYIRRYVLKEVADGDQVFQPEADEEEFDSDRVERAHPVVEGREGVVPEGRHEDRSEVGGCDGSRWWPPGRQQEYRPGVAGSGGEAGREAADGEGLDGPVGTRRVRPQQAGLEPRGGGAQPEGPVLGCCTPWARVEPVCDGCPIWGGPGVVGVADGGVLGDDGRSGGFGVEVAPR